MWYGAMGQAMTGLERDVVALKREVSERDDTIGDKEKRIHDLKRKNQELEKFKFVLDYKIKELKRQIEPREAELARLKEQIQARTLCPQLSRAATPKKSFTSLSHSPGSK